MAYFNYRIDLILTNFAILNCKCRTYLHSNRIENYLKGSCSRHFGKHCFLLPIMNIHQYQYRPKMSFKVYIIVCYIWCDTCNLPKKAKIAIAVWSITYLAIFFCRMHKSLLTITWKGPICIYASAIFTKIWLIQAFVNISTIKSISRKSIVTNASKASRSV